MSLDSFCMRHRKWAFALPIWLTGLLAVAPVAHAADPATPVQHVVVIFQENVSFDHYFATYPVAANNSASEPAFHALPGTPSVNGLNGSLMTHNPNSVQP